MLPSIRRITSNKLIYRKIFKHFSSLHSVDNVLTSGEADFHIPETLIHEYVFDYFSKWDENRIAMECSLSGRNYTYKELRRKTNGLAKSLRKILKLEQGDVVALLVPNIPEYPIATLGILKAGLVMTTINPIYTPAEINKQLLDSGTKAIITIVELFPQVKESLNQCKLNIPIVTIKTQKEQTTPAGAIDFIELANQINLDSPVIQNASQTDLAVLPYSSGTTGLPKGVELTHLNIIANIHQINHPNVIISRTATNDHQPVTVAVLPMFHIYGFTIGTLHQLVCGSKIFTLPKFTPESYINALSKHKPHLLYVAPPIAIFLGNNPNVNKEHFDRLETISSGAACLGALDEEKLLNKINKPTHILQGYGLTETSPVVTIVRIETKRKFNCKASVGTPVPNTEVKVIATDDDTDGEPLGPNQKGELLVRGPQVMRKYYNRPEETKNAFLDGWFRTGDIVYYDDNGLLYVTDRLKELIKVKGFQVAPAEIEEILRSYPDVDDAAVIGIPHTTHGEVPKAFIVPKAGTELDVQKLNDFVNKKISSYKQLQGGIEIIDKIPKNTTGKILRRQLKLLS